MFRTKTKQTNTQRLKCMGFVTAISKSSAFRPKSMKNIENLSFFNPPPQDSTTGSISIDNSSFFFYDMCGAVVLLSTLNIVRIWPHAEILRGTPKECKLRANCVAWKSMLYSANCCTFNMKMRHNKTHHYRAGRPICHKVLKIMFWEVPRLIG